MRGETSETAMVGAVLIADGLRCARVLAAFVEGMGKKKGGRRHV